MRHAFRSESSAAGNHSITACTFVLLLLCSTMTLGGCGQGTGSDLSDLAVVDHTIPFPNGCTNGLTDNDESDVDCGGSCTPCVVGKTCNAPGDCQSAVCVNRLCIAGTCNDKVKNNDETDIDCAGSCPNKCAEGQHCKDGIDCQSGTCANNVCAPSLCANQQHDGMETDVDCGGPTCMGCVDGKKCKDGIDCLGMMCVNDLCAGGGGDCMNMKKDGAETDVDCGGRCGKCADGKACGGAGDCLNANCSKGTCCAQGFATCGNVPACATSLQNDGRNCGGCGVVCPANMPACAAGKCKLPSVLVVGSETGIVKQLMDVAQKIQATGAFSVVDTFEAGVATPTVGKLQMYDSVIVYSDGDFADAVAIGDNLATFIDNGGYLVTAMFGLSLENPIKGRFGDPQNGYILIAQAPIISTPDSLGTILEPMSPLVKDVASLSANKAWRTNGNVINGGIVVAQWGSKQPLIVRGQVKGRNRIDLNLAPFSADSNQDAWKGDGAVLLRNALLFR